MKMRIRTPIGQFDCELIPRDIKPIFPMKKISASSGNKPVQLTPVSSGALISSLSFEWQDKEGKRIEEKDLKLLIGEEQLTILPQTEELVFEQSLLKDKYLYSYLPELVFNVEVSDKTAKQTLQDLAIKMRDERIVYLASMVPVQGVLIYLAALIPFNIEKRGYLFRVYLSSVEVV